MRTFDLERLLPVPEKLSPTAAEVTPAHDMMTEMVIGPIPSDFDLQRAKSAYEDIIKKRYESHPGFIFVVTYKDISKEGKKESLVVAFDRAVDTEKTKVDLGSVIRREMIECGQKPEVCDYFPFRNNIYPRLLANHNDAKPS